MLRPALATLAVVLAAPIAAAQQAAPPKQRWTKNSEARLGRWAERVRRTLAERSAPQLRAWLRESAVPELRAHVVTRNKLRSSLVRRDVVLIYAALGTAPAVDDALALLGLWQKSAKRAEEIDGEYFQVLGPLADLGPIGQLTPAQRDTLYARMEWTAKKAAHKLDLAIPAMERAGERRYVELLTGDALKYTKYAGTDAPLMRQRIAESLGRWWDFAPALDVRVPALLKLAGDRAEDTRNAALAGLDRLLLGWSDDSPKKTVKAFQLHWKAHPADGAVLTTLARLRKADEAPAALAPDMARRLDEMKRRDSDWATPLFLEVFGWTEPELGIARAGAIKSLAFTRDAGAIAALIDLLAGLDSPQQKAEAIAAIGRLAGATDGDPARTVVEILRGSLRKGHPLPRTAAAAAIGDLRLVEAVDELIAYGDEADFRGRSAAWRALAQLGTPKAEAALLQRFDDAPNADRPPLVQAFGAWHTLPLPDAIAERVGTAWDAEDTPDLRAAAVTAATHRGPAHPSLTGRIRRLLVDGGAPEEQALEALRDISAWAGEADARPLLIAVLAAGPSANREDLALHWLRARPAADLRAPALRIVADTTRSGAIRTAVARLVGVDAVWDVRAVGLPLITVLGASAGDVELSAAIRDALQDHADPALVPPLIALLPSTPPHHSEPTAAHTFLVWALLSRWGGLV
ncbi:MAG: HEAT repeat domain-containing protein, partial [Planctomycetota bacterium]